MFKRLSFGRSLLLGGGVLGLLGLLLWHVVAVPEKLPPFAMTAALAIVCGLFELWRERDASQP